jgi:hypothetical protein
MRGDGSTGTYQSSTDSRTDESDCRRTMDHASIILQRLAAIGELNEATVETVLYKSRWE